MILGEFVIDYLDKHYTVEDGWICNCRTGIKTRFEYEIQIELKNIFSLQDHVTTDLFEKWLASKGGKLLDMVYFRQGAKIERATYVNYNPCLEITLPVTYENRQFGH